MADRFKKEQNKFVGWWDETTSKDRKFSRKISRKRLKKQDEKDRIEDYKHDVFEEDFDEEAKESLADHYDREGSLKERIKMEVKEPTELILYKTSDNKQFSTLEAARTREAEIAFEEYYKPFSLIIQETGMVSAEKMQHWLDKYRYEIEGYYQIADKE